MGKVHNQAPGAKKRDRSLRCESCGLLVDFEVNGCYEVTMVTRVGPGKSDSPRRVLWRLCSIACVELFARGHTHLDTALGGYKGESESEGEDEE
jgi:hypothetical protein